MKKVTLPSFFLKAFAKALLLFFLSFSLFAQDDEREASNGADPVAGKALFNAQCAACHALDKNMTGPALRGVGDKYEMEWLYKWVKNSSELIRSGDARANKIFAEWNNSVMTAFPQLSNQDIDNIIAYTMQPKQEVVAEAAVAGSDAGSGDQSGITNQIVLIALVMVMIILLVLLYLVKNVLDKVAFAQGVEIQNDSLSFNPKGIWAAFVKNQFLVLVSVIFLLLSSAYFAYGWMMQIGVDKGYEPIQPIHYSHRIHAGDNGIDCKYCHSAARESKHSNIPSLNVCMNCHMNIAEVADATYQEGLEYGVDYNQEIQKLYDAVGWDTSTRTYTGNSKPVKWVRIHNLPDLVYFNHAQHVTAGGIECQTCHGPVEEMEVLYQHAPLTMGWCINCHRETEVQLKDNEYYTKIHEQLAKQKGVERLTAADLGGLECGKCHY